MIYSQKNTVRDIITKAAPDQPALATVENCHNILDYNTLCQIMEKTCHDLNSIGIGTGDRIAIALPNGIFMATAFLSIAGGCSAAPLNPAYTEDEFTFYLNDLNAKAIILMEGSTSPAIQAAEALNIPILWLCPQQENGIFSLDISRGDRSQAITESIPQPHDEALVLHTSGTTSRPKIVPLTNAHITASAHHIRDSLNLTPKDRSLNIMPLFHIHGLIASLLASMAAEAMVICTPGFNALKFFKWLDIARPSWYTAVPTMHQSIISRAKDKEDILKSLELRFIRSSSSSLPAPVMEQVEKTFTCPVVEAYGMTEAAHQMATNPLPPKRRKAGSVGLAAGPDVSILDINGNDVAQGYVGEICIKGANVFAGYENNPAANLEAFHNGWFRTGDEGYFDKDGYLHISGRLKEIINRGGEKISPREVDDILQAHPAINQVVAFAIPHPKLGEDIAAAIVVEEGLTTTEAEIREFAAKKLASFKVPRRIVFLDAIPKGATGKLQRIGLAEKLGLI